MSTTFDTRRENLRRLVMDRLEGNRAALSRAAGAHPNHINLILSDNPEHHRNMGETFARRLEAALGLPAGYMDLQHSGGREVEIYAKDPPPEADGLLVKNTNTTCLRMRAGHMMPFKSRITAVENLILARTLVGDLAPEVPVDTAVVLDVGQKAVTDDGYYVLVRGSSSFLRRVTAKISGGWDISGGGESVHVDSLKGIKAAGRLVAAITATML